MKFFVIFLIIFNYQILLIKCLKCRIDDGPSDDELKKITRTCIKKIMGNDNNSNNNNNGSYDDGNDNDDSYYGDGDNYNREPFRVRNRDNLQGKTTNKRPKRLSPTQMNHEWNYQQQHQQQQQQQYGNMDNNNNNNRRHNVMSSMNNNQRNNNSYNGMSMGNGKDYRRNQNDNYDYDYQNCVVHCFFGELNTLNDDGFPDKHKVLHVLTRDIRDRELREFYTDTIKDCFTYLNQEYRKDKCQFSKSLINCMAEYSRANCDDWYDHTVIFN